VQVRSGDWFSAGGWCGQIRTIEHSRPTQSATKPAPPKGKAGKKPTKASGTKAAQLPEGLQPDYAGPGIAVHLLVTLHEDINEPRPLGDSVRFHRDRGLLKHERKTRELRAANGAAAALENGADSEAASDDTEASESRGMVPVSSVRQTGTTIEPSLKTVRDEEFSLAKDAALHCMERSQLEVKLAEFAVDPADALRWGLERLCAQFSRQKPGFTGSFSICIGECESG
jgi:hypothetical protein